MLFKSNSQLRADIPAGQGQLRAGREPVTGASETIVGEVILPNLANPPHAFIC